MEKVRTPVWVIVYNNKNISADIAPFVLSVTYTDKVSGESDELEIEVEDRSDLWKSKWIPTKGDEINLKIGYEGEKLLPCGVFQVDEVGGSGPPDVMKIKALGTGITQSLRQENTVAYEEKTLKQIAADIAAKHGFTIIGEIRDIKVKRITQKQERDLSFLLRLAREYGYNFKVNGKQLVFTEKTVLETAASVITIDRRDLIITWDLSSKSTETYSACEVSYHDPESKKDISHTVNAQGVAKADTLKVKVRCENKAQAIEKANAALHTANSGTCEGNITVTGVPKLVAGSNIDITCLHSFNGTYHIKTSKHTMTRDGGYTTELEVNRV